MPFPIQFNFNIASLYGGQQLNITFHSGLTVLVGPNGAGKTQFLKKLRNALNPFSASKIIRYLSAGRMAHLEQYRSNYWGQGNLSAAEAHIGIGTYEKYRHTSETASGDFHTLHVRSDIQIKVKERLEKLFRRNIQIDLSSGQLKVFFNSTDSESQYSFANEASGLLQMVVLLAAIYDDEVGALLIDEPEISLHPQLQSFLYNEISRIAGDPVEPGKKLVVLSTHSTEFISIRKAPEICNLIFFNDWQTPPAQIISTDPILQSRDLKSLLTRLGLNQKLAFFSVTPLLVEGPSDQTICTALENKLGLYLGAAGSQIVPVTGTGQIPIVYKFFKLLGKSPVIITDIDSFADGLTLINSITFSATANQKATEWGAASVQAVASNVYNAFVQLIQNNWADISQQAETTRIWTQRITTADPVLYQRRAGMVFLLSAGPDVLQAINNSQQWQSISTRIKAVLILLEYGGCFILKKGYIEDYFQFVNQNLGLEKTETAVKEMIGIEDAADINAIRTNYADIIDALKYAAQVPAIDEAKAISELLLCVASPAILDLDDQTTNIKLQNKAKQILQGRADLFNLSVSEEGGEKIITIDNKSKILDVKGFPLKFKKSSNPVVVVTENITKT